MYNFFNLNKLGELNEVISKINERYWAGFSYL